MDGAILVLDWKSVAKLPGSTIVIRMPSGATFLASASDKPSTANLVAPWPPPVATLTRPATLDTARTWPVAYARNIGSSA